MDGWQKLGSELDLWAGSGRRATFWWRDDDAVQPTPALARLLALAAETGTPLCLAVIPASAGRPLADRVRENAGLTVAQHGFAHQNHAPPTARKSELGADRPLDVRLDELRRGRDRLRRLFGPTFQALLVPPWNRIGADLLPRLQKAGYHGLSTSGPRAAVRPPGALRLVNCHCDPVDWHSGRGFVGAPAALDLLCGHLRARREGRADRDEPTGLLTHHLVMDGATWDFVRRLFDATRDHPGSYWLTCLDALATADTQPLPAVAE